MPRERPSNPAIPGTRRDRTGSTQLLRKALAAIDARWAGLTKDVLVAFDRIPVYAVNDTGPQVAYGITPAILDIVLLEIASALDRWVQNGKEPKELFWWDPFVEQASALGALQSVTNLTNLSPAYAASRSFDQVIRSEPYLTRVALARMKSYEHWTGLRAEGQSRLAGIIGRAVADGLNPKAARTLIVDGLGVTRSKAAQYAQTDITDTLRQARWAESEAAQTQYGLKIGMLWTSALLPNTRGTHAARNGKVFSTDEVRDFYSRNGNRYNCHCGQTECLLDVNGKPILTNGLRQKMDAELAAWHKQKTLKSGKDTIPESHPWHATQGKTLERDWHDAAFSGSPQWLQKKVAQRGPLKGGVLSDPKELALYAPSKDAMNMPPGYDNMDDLRVQGVWRHEYGHAMDFTFGSDGFPRSSESDFGVAMHVDARGVIKAASDRKGLSIAEAQSAHALHQAKDSKQWLHERYARLGLDFAQVQDAMRAHTDFAVTLQGMALEDRYRRIAVALEMRDAEGLMAALAGGMDSAAGEIERKITYRKGNVGNLSDLFGSATKNKVAGVRSGFGHSDSYYNDSPGIAQHAECFANLTSFYGDANPVWSRFAELMTPHMAALFKEIMK